MKSEAEILAEKISSGEKAVLKAEKQLSHLKEMFKAKAAEADCLPGIIMDAKKKIGTLETQIKIMETNETECREKLSLARQKADEAKGSMQQSRNRGNVINSLLRMRDSGRIKGIHGRLGNLGVIDDKYDIAISTACPALDNIVVDTVEAGQACISYLRENNIGRANFTILQKLRDQDLRPIRTPEDVPRLFDLIQPKEEKFAPAFYSIMADTLVVKNLTQANRIAYGQKRWRVVTLDGKLIEKSGVMTGGGNRPQRGAMGSRFKGDEISAESVALLEKERNQLEADLRQIMDERHSYEMDLRSNRDTLPRKEMSLEKLEMDKRSLEKQIKDEEARLTELNTQTKPKPADVQRLKDIGKNVETLEQDIKNLKGKADIIEEKIRTLHEDIMEAGGMELRLQKIVVNDMTTRIKTLDEKITKNTYAKSKAEKDVISKESFLG
ncbi:SMCs flexible hinge [Phycomyces nitens]|nr:SMCs flexible hinge [Phycomyces nitens]